MTQIHHRAAGRLLDSVAFLNNHYGKLLNGHITLNFEQLGLSNVPDSKQALTDLNEHLARKLDCTARKLEASAPLYYVYAHERCERYGWHVHELISAPPGMLTEIKAWLKHWVAGRYGAEAVSRGALEFKRLGGRSVEVKLMLQARLLRYILKTMGDCLGVDRHGQPASVLGLLEITRRQVSLPLPIRRVVGVSQNLSRGVQLKENFERPEHWEDLLTGKSYHERRSDNNSEMTRIPREMLE